MSLNAKCLIVSLSALLTFAQGARADEGSAQAANDASSTDGSTAATSGVMAGSLATMCNKPQGNVAPCIMSALSVAQMIAAGAASSGAASNATQNETTTAAGTTTTTDTNAATNGASSVAATAAAVKAQLAAAGAPVSADNSTMTLPNGSNVDLNGSAGTDAGMAAAGLTKDQIDQGHAALATALAKAGVTAKSESNGEMGGTNAIIATGGATSLNRNSIVSAKGGSKAKSSLSGLTKNLGNDKIGVSADNIFEMITRRYQARDSAGTFNKN